MSAAAGSGAKQSSGCCGLCALNDYRKKAGLSCSFIIFAALNIAMVYNGAENIQRCPAEPMIPVYLLGKELLTAFLFCHVWAYFYDHSFIC